ncbi:unnamed protein product, partial [Symbiodinium sp. KB8]
VVPVSGMLFGNATSAAALAVTGLLRGFAEQRSALELRLARGATATEALKPLIRSSLSDALTPTINTLAVTGVVHLPGMMTGQILAGQSPQQAAAYQTLILFLIASTTCIVVQLVTALVSGSLMDFKNARLLQKLRPRAKPKNEASRKDKLIQSGTSALAMKIFADWFHMPSE